MTKTQQAATKLRALACFVEENEWLEDQCFRGYQDGELVLMCLDKERALEIVKRFPEKTFVRYLRFEYDKAISWKTETNGITLILSEVEPREFPKPPPFESTPVILEETK